MSLKDWLQNKLAPPRDVAANERYLRADHLSGSDLGQRSVGGGLVTLGAQVIKVAVQFITIVILARMLEPEDFGIFAIISVFLSALELLKDMGLSTVTVQRPDITDRQVSTLFWLNAALGVGVAALLALLAWPLSWFYEEPKLLTVTPVVAVAFIFTGMAAQHCALIRRQMEFTQAAISTVGAEVIAMAAAIMAALFGMGIWALAIQRIVWSIVICIWSWNLCGWRPGKPGPISDVMGMVVYGGNASAAMIISHFVSSMDKALIGWYWGTSWLGLFERAQKLTLIPIQNLNLPLATVAIPALSRLADQPARYRKAYVAAAERLTMLVAPVSGLLIAAPDQVVNVILGPQWVDAGPILAWMGVASVYMPVTYTLSWLYMTQDRTAEMLWAGLVNSVLTLVALFVGLPFGAVSVAAVYGISGVFVRVPVLLWLVGRAGPVRFTDFAAVLIPSTCGTIAAAVVVYALRFWSNLESLPGIPTLIIMSLGAGIASIAVFAAFPQARGVMFDVLRLPRLLLKGRASA
jgi:PST family polysaccharide transporter